MGAIENYAFTQLIPHGLENIAIFRIVNNITRISSAGIIILVFWPITRALLLLITGLTNHSALFLSDPAILERLEPISVKLADKQTDSQTDSILR